MKKVLLIGADGMLGGELKERLEKIYDVESTTIETLDICNKEDVLKKANEVGYTSGAIDLCYTQPNPSVDTKYFSVRLYITFQLPLISNAIQIPITGETIGIRKQNRN
mgnify:CR=1 FL=1